jgi:hypothetical protein
MIHYWDRDYIRSLFICTPPLVTSWSGINCPGCGAVVTDKAIADSPYRDMAKTAPRLVCDVLAGQT